MPLSVVMTVDVTAIVHVSFLLSQRSGIFCRWTTSVEFSWISAVDQILNIPLKSSSVPSSVKNVFV